METATLTCEALMLLGYQIQASNGVTIGLVTPQWPGRARRSLAEPTVSDRRGQRHESYES